jgi:DNA primase large subunit
LHIQLQVLRKIEELKTRNTPHEAFRTALTTSLKQHLSTPKIDTASHYILRAAYCRSEDLRRWFLAQECKLFSFRLENCKSIRDFMKKNEIDLERVERNEKDRLREKLTSVVGAPSPMEYASTEYYKVPFGEALRLVGNRECYLERGMAYIPLAKIISIVEAKFRAALSKSLAYAGNHIDNATAEEHTRIGPLLKSMNSQYTGPTHLAGVENGEALTAANVDASVRSMPLCMSQLHAGLKRDHKLKHQGRLQFGLFLKGAGMTMEEHTMFFQREFTKIMTGEQFNKQYGYGIRHMHGKEGKRASYTPYNCMKIVMGTPPGGGEHHGCPYKHYDEENLSALLGKLKIGGVAEREAILKLKRDGNPNLACAKHFEIMHPSAGAVEGVSLEGVGNHPNAWFTASRKYYEAKDGGGKVSPSKEIEVMQE